MFLVPRVIRKKYASSGSTKIIILGLVGAEDSIRNPNLSSQQSDDSVTRTVFCCDSLTSGQLLRALELLIAPT